MTIYNLGSINIDRVYALPHLPQPGETLASLSHSVGLGGKGANQSAAAARFGAEVRHLGAVGSDGGAIVDRMRGLGINVTGIRVVEAAHTGHAIINVDASGENSIVLDGGTNMMQSAEAIATALADATAADTLLLQNETDCQVDAARIGHEKGMRVVYSAAPFDAAAVEAVLPYVSMLVLNQVEAAQLAEATGLPIERVDVDSVVVTRGGDGAEWLMRGRDPMTAAAYTVPVVDTTGAGDCFIGTLAAALDVGLSEDLALRAALAAGALQVTRRGTADVMPDRAEVETFLNRPA